MKWTKIQNINDVYEVFKYIDSHILLSLNFKPISIVIRYTYKLLYKLSKYKNVFNYC